MTATVLPGSDGQACWRFTITDGQHKKSAIFDGYPTATAGRGNTDCTCLGHFTAFHHQLTTVGLICMKGNLEIKCYFLKLISFSYDVNFLSRVIGDEGKEENKIKWWNFGTDLSFQVNGKLTLYVHICHVCNGLYASWRV